MTGSLTAWARETYEDLDKEGLGPLTRRIFLDLVHPGDESRGVPDNRQRKLLRDLGRGDDERQVHMVVDRLADARLVTTSFADETRRDTVVEIIHDSLIREWRLLQEWIKENRIFMAWEGKVREDARDWISFVDKEKRRDRDRLLSGQRLAEAERWRKERGLDLGPEVREYIDASLDWQREREEARERERQEKERDRKRTIRRLSALSMVAIVLFITSAFLYTQSEEQRLQIENQQIRTQALYDASRSDALRDNPGRFIDSIELAVKSLSASRTVDGDHALRECLKLLPHPVSLMSHNGSVRAITFSPDGRRIATASFDGTAGVWDADTGEEMARVEHGGIVWAIAFSPDGRRIAIAGEDSTASVWDAATGEKLAEVEHDGPVQAVAFSPDGTRIATASYDNTARVWDAATGEELAKVEHDSSVSDVAFSPDGKRIATASGSSAYIHTLVTAELICEACSRLTCNLMTEEWHRDYCSECEG